MIPEMNQLDQQLQQLEAVPANERDDQWVVQYDTIVEKMIDLEYSVQGVKSCQ